MSSGIYKDSEARKEYLRNYYSKSKQQKMQSKEYIIRQCMRAVRKLRKEIGDYSCDRVLEVLKEEVNK